MARIANLFQNNWPSHVILHAFAEPARTNPKGFRLKQVVSGGEDALDVSILGLVASATESAGE